MKSRLDEITMYYICPCCQHKATASMVKWSTNPPWWFYQFDTTDSTNQTVLTCPNCRGQHVIKKPFYYEI